MIRVINSPDQTFPYRRFIRRLNFSSMHEHLTDEFILQLDQCERLERLTLAGCKLIGSEALVTLLSKTTRLIALDLSDVPKAGDDVAETIARSCPKLQGLNLSGCKALTDKGLEAVARNCFQLRRVSEIVFATDLACSQLIRSPTA
jgi:F-box and leucine-rich repeat protein GRR1